MQGAAAAASYKRAVWLQRATLLLRIYPKQLLAPVRNNLSILSMTLEEVLVQEAVERAQRSGKALEEALLWAKANQAVTVGVYESAKVMNV